MIDKELAFRVVNCRLVYELLRQEILKHNIKVQGKSIHDLLIDLIESQETPQQVKMDHPFADDAKNRIRKSLPRLADSLLDVPGGCNWYTRAPESGPYVVRRAYAKRLPGFQEAGNPTCELYVVWLEENENVEDARNRLLEESRLSSGFSMSDNGGSIPEPNEEEHTVETNGVASVTVEAEQPVKVTVTFD